MTFRALLQKNHPPAARPEMVAMLRQGVPPPSTHLVKPVLTTTGRGSSGHSTEDVDEGVGFIIVFYHLAPQG